MTDNSERKFPHRGKAALGVVAALVFSSAFMWRCANIAAPQGGPKDTLPPVVVGALPAFNTTGFDGRRIYISFDEYVQLKNQQSEFFTSPPMENKPQLSVKGRGIQIDLKDTLAPNTTYVLYFGSSVSDNNEGNPLNGLRYVFSTGSQIDSMFMSGYAADAYKKDSVSKAMLFFYEATDSIFTTGPFRRLGQGPANDTLPVYDSTLFIVRPDFIARAENNGIFIAQNLKPVDYRVYAFEDKNGNFTYEPGTERVGFLEGTFNPVDLPGFTAWYDTTRRYMTAEPQLYFRMFTDRQFKRQNLAESKRPSQHKIEFYFSAPDPVIDSIVLDGIAPGEIITEYVSAGRDTINLWLDVPAQRLPDTIRGSITYLKHDSINNLVPNTDKLTLFWKYVETKEEERRREKEERERKRAEEAGEIYTPPAVPNPFKYTLSAKGEVNPESDVTIDFDYPLVAVDTARISLQRIGENDARYRVRYTVARDSTNLRRWILSAPWTPGEKYMLEIPDSVFVDVAGQRNDSIKQEFSMLKPDDFGTLTVKVSGGRDGVKYILQLLSDKNSLLQEKRDVVDGDWTFRYISPGEVKLRVVEDVNGNGRWDPGDLVLHRQPERVEIYVPANGNELMTMKVNWEIETAVDMTDLFRPLSIDDIRRQLRQQELQRAVRLAEERAEKAKQKQKEQNSSSSTGMGGFGSGNTGRGGGLGPGNGGGLGGPSSQRVRP